MGRKKEPEKYCLTCGILLCRKRYGRTLEDFTVFMKRKYCSLSCANTRKTVTISALHKRAVVFRGKHCEICGEKSKLHAHHIDGNIENNTQENIQTLCTHCHNTFHHLCHRRGDLVAGRMIFRESQEELKTG